MNYAFTFFFAFELAINAFGWNLLDAIVVLVSAASLGPNSLLNMTVIRMLRALRVVRLFGRVESLKKVVSALTASIIPMTNAFIILLIITCIYAVIGVTLFGEINPIEFGVFDRAFVTLFQITCGATWVTNLPVVKEDGDVNGTLTAYIVTYVIVTNWVVLQVSVAILLESFVTVSGKMEAEEERRRAMALKEIHRMESPLDPLLERLAKKYVNDEDLTTRLKTLYHVLDGDGSGSLSSHEFCEAIKKLYTDRNVLQDFKPPIYMSDSDFVNFTMNRTLCDPEGNIGEVEFERVMRQNLTVYMQMVLSETAENQTGEEFVQFSALKMLLASQVKTQENIQVLLRATGTQQPVQHSSFRNKVKSPRSLATDNVTERLESNEPSGDLSRPKEISGPASFLMADSGEDNGIAKELAAIRATLEDMREARIEKNEQMDLVVLLRESVLTCQQLMLKLKEAQSQHGTRIQQQRTSIPAKIETSAGQFENPALLERRTRRGSAPLRSATPQLFPPALSQAPVAAAPSPGAGAAMPVTAGSSVGGHPTQQMARPQVQHQNDQMTRIAAPAPDWTQRAAGAAAAPKRLRPIFYAEHMSRKQALPIPYPGTPASTNMKPAPTPILLPPYERQKPERQPFAEAPPPPPGTNLHGHNAARQMWGGDLGQPEVPGHPEARRADLGGSSFISPAGHSRAMGRDSDLVLVSSQATSMVRSWSSPPTSSQHRGQRRFVPHVDENGLA